MARFIPNENTWVGFATTITDIDAPTSTEIGGATELTKFVAGLNFSVQGSAVPTPNFETLFETSINGTAQGQATMDCYRDDTSDDAWDAFPRGTSGFVLISRYGGKPDTTGDAVEVWPVRVVSRANANLSNNTVATFTVTFAVPEEPSEDAAVAA